MKVYVVIGDLTVAGITETHIDSVWASEEDAIARVKAMLDNGWDSAESIERTVR